MPILFSWCILGHAVMPNTFPSCIVAGSRGAMGAHAPSDFFWRARGHRGAQCCEELY